MPYAIVCAGTSWGGLLALRKLLHDLSESFTLPVVVVQHRHRDSDGLLADLLQDCTPRPVSEVEDKEPVEQGRVYVAPANYHLLIDDGHFALSTDPPVRFSRPSIDVTFSAAADEYGSGAIGIVLTGANADGAEGLRRIAEAGGAAIVQDPDTAESPVMPRAALRAVPTAVRLRLDEIAPYLGRVVTSGPPRPRLRNEPWHPEPGPEAR